MKSIVLTGGGTAGHCIPNLALIPFLKEKFNKIYYIGSENGIERNLVKDFTIEYFPISCAKFRRKICFENIKIPFNLLKGIKEVSKILDKIKPNVIFSKGGYVALPTVFAAHKKGIPVISHESDLTIGLANKLTSRYCDKVLTSFEETANKLKNGVHVGPPLRNSLFNVDVTKSLKILGLEGKKPILLIMGGSQGATTINHFVRACLPHLLEKFEVLHVCGKNNLQEIKAKGYYQFEYLNNIEHAFSIASVCVTRGGSNSLFELLSQKIPCVVIPLPNGVSRGDQILNAKYFQSKSLVNVLLQEDLCVSTLLKQIFETYNNRKDIIKRIEEFKIENACPKIAKIIFETINI